MSQELVGAPVFGKLDGSAADVAMILLEFRLETREKRESIGGRAGKSGENLVLVKAADFLRGVFDNPFAERNLSVTGHDHIAVPADAQNRSGTYQSFLWHERNS